MTTTLEKECRQKAKELGLKVKHDRSSDIITLVVPSGLKTHCNGWDDTRKHLNDLDPLDIEPHHWNCIENASGCGWRGNNPIKVKFPSYTIGICRNCEGKIEGNEQWDKWVRRQQEKQRQRAIKNNNGYMFGVDVCTPKERAELNKVSQ